MAAKQTRKHVPEVFRHVIMACLLVSVVVCIKNPTPVEPTSLNPLDYFSYTYRITLSQQYVDDGQVFYAEISGTATCIKDAPINPTEAYIRGRVIALHIETGKRVALNSGYSSTVSPVPSITGEVISDTQELPLYFPWDSPPGEYKVTGELLEARFKAGGLWVDATDSFPQTQDMGYAFYKIPQPAPPPTTTTSPPTTTTSAPPATSVSPTTTAPPATTPVTTTTTTPPVTVTPTQTATPTTTTTPEPTKTHDPSPVIPPAPDGAVSLSELLDGNNKLISDLEISSADELSHVLIKAQTTVTGEDNPLEWLMLTRAPDTPGTANDIWFAGSSYQMLPEFVSLEPGASLGMIFYKAMLPAGIDVQLLKIARWDKASNSWVVLDNSTIDLSNTLISAPIYQGGTYTIIAPVSTPDFVLSNFLITPIKAASGEMVNIQLRVTNTGTMSGYYNLTLTINDIIHEVRRIALGGGESRVVSFGVVRNSAGTYNVNLNGLSGTYDVSTQQHSYTTIPSEPPASSQDKPVFYWVWVLYAVNGALLVTAIFLLRHWLARKLFKRRKQ